MPNHLADQFEVVNESSCLPGKLIINTTKSFVVWFGSFLEINLIHRTICRFNMNLQPCPWPSQNWADGSQALPSPCGQRLHRAAINSTAMHRHGRPGRADPSRTLIDAARPIATASPPAAACHPPPRPAPPRRRPPAASHPAPTALDSERRAAHPRRRLACFPLVAPASQLPLAPAAPRGRPAASALRRRHRALARARGRVASGNGATPRGCRQWPPSARRAVARCPCH